MKTLTLLLGSSLITATIEAQNVLMPGAFTRKLGLDASTTKSINLEPIVDESSYQLATWKLSGKMGDLTPDSTIFEKVEYNYDTLSQRLRELSFLNSGVAISITDKRTGKSQK